jgi:Zn-dependent protease
MVSRLLALLISFTIHEFSHGYAAYLLGDSTAKHDGRLSLNPLKHIDVMGFIMLMVVGFGWAKPVMVDPRRLKNPKGDMAIISFCGPASNFIMAFLFVMLFPATSVLPEVIEEFAFIFLLQGFYMNIGLGVFNMLPIPPLDGLKVYSSLLPDEMYWRVMQFNSNAGSLIFLILAFTGMLSRILRPLVEAVAQAYLVLANSIFSLFT